MYIGHDKKKNKFAYLHFQNIVLIFKHDRNKLAKGQKKINWPIYIFKIS